MNGQSKMRRWMTQQAFRLLRENPEFKQRFEREFGTGVDAMEQGYERGDEKFCSAVKKRGLEMVEQNPAQAAQVRKAFLGAGVPRETRLN